MIKARLSSANLMPGTYIVKGNMSADDMIEIMSDQANSVVEQPTAEELETDNSETESAEDTSADTSEGEGGN